MTETVEETRSNKQIFQELRGYLGNQNIISAGQNYQYTQWEIDEFVKCSQDIHYFIKNYIKIVHIDHGLIPFELYPYQKKIIDALVKERFIIGKLPRQSGKALPLSQKIPTPAGWTTMGNLKVGDYVLSPSGKPVMVSFKTETMYNHTCYEIEFDNGEVIKADADHLWEVNSTYWNTGKKVLNTQDIFDAYQKKPSNKRGKGVAGSYFIEHSKPQEFAQKDLSIDPYLFGLWIGDGDKNCNLEFYSLIKNKHIPIDFLRASFEQRLALLQGLMDTVGSVKRDSRSYEFYQKDETIIESVRELLSSLGIKSRLRKKLINDCYYYTISFTTELDVFRLPRKLIKVNKDKSIRSRDKRIYITSIRPAETEPVACIQVDSEDHLYLVGNTYIPTHNTTTTVAYILWYILFHANSKVAILAHRANTARELFSKIRLAYEHLPKFLQAGIAPGGWNKGSITLGNGSSVKADATSSGSIRGESFNVIFLDEFAFVPNKMAEEFINSVYPTISSGKKSKVIIFSTPKGTNHFYEMWEEAIAGKNGFTPIWINWNEVPGRDENWKKEQISKIGLRSWNQEFECQFIGSATSLLEPEVMQEMWLKYKDNQPEVRHGDFKIYELPKSGHKYVICVDSSRGLGLDYHAFTVFDVTNLPYKQIATYHNNTLYPTIFPNVIARCAKEYNEAHILVEISDIGQQVADMLIGDLDCENVIRTMNKPGVGQTIGFGFAGRVQNGIKTSTTTKRVGCADLKTLIESGNLIIQDPDTIKEFFTFVASNQSYTAEEGYHDDLVMTCVLFGWLSHQRYFREEAHDIRELIEKQQEEFIENSITPFGVYDDGQEQFSVDYGGDENIFGNY